MYSEVLVARDVFTENEEFCFNVGLMSAVLVKRGADEEGLENISILYFNEKF